MPQPDSEKKGKEMYCKIRMTREATGFPKAAMTHILRKIKKEEGSPNSSMCQESSFQLQ